LKITVRRPGSGRRATRQHRDLPGAGRIEGPIGELVVHDVNGSPIEIATSESKGAAYYEYLRVIGLPAANEAQQSAQQTSHH
jgi:hypothetical protein